MRFVTFTHDGSQRAGVLIGDGSGRNDEIVDLAHTSMAGCLGTMPPQVSDFITAGLSTIVSTLDAHGLRAEARLPLADVVLAAPIPMPRRIFGVAFNYNDALAERGMAPPDAPVLFVKEPDTVIATGEPIRLPEGVGGVTYEAELAVVIGLGGKDIAHDSALSHVAGYAAFNDISASEMIKRDSDFYKGKNLPTFGPFGPYLASADEIPDPQELRISLTMGGKTLQKSTTAQMLFGVADLISILSRDVRLEPGDIIATGTPAGVAPVRTPPSWLRAGTELSMTLEGLGTLTNPVEEGPPLNG